jgi:hypothetical protein
MTTLQRPPSPRTASPDVHIWEAPEQPEQTRAAKVVVRTLDELKAAIRQGLLKEGTENRMRVHATGEAREYLAWAAEQEEGKRRILRISENGREGEPKASVKVTPVEKARLRVTAKHLTNGRADGIMDHIKNQGANKVRMILKADQANAMSGEEAFGMLSLLKRQNKRQNWIKMLATCKRDGSLYKLAQKVLGMEFIGGLSAGDFADLSSDLNDHIPHFRTEASADAIDPPTITDVRLQPLDDDAGSDADSGAGRYAGMQEELDNILLHPKPVAEISAEPVSVGSSATPPPAVREESEGTVIQQILRDQARALDPRRAGEDAIGEEPDGAVLQRLARALDPLSVAKEADAEPGSIAAKHAAKLRPPRGIQ